MSLKDRIEEDYKKAFKQGKTTIVSCLRSLKAAIKNVEIDARHDFSDAETEKVVTSEVKRTKESLEAFQKGGRSEQVAVLQEQIGILTEYMPEQLSDTAITQAVTAAITATGASGPADMGKVMGAVMKELQGRADGTVVRARVQELLGKP